MKLHLPAVHFEFAIERKSALKRVNDLISWSVMRIFPHCESVQASFITVTCSLSHPAARCKSNSDHFQD